MSFGIYSIGFLILIAGVAYLAHLMHIPQSYIVATVIILIGIGVLTAVKNTRGKDPN
jgi:energy-converting hydrogenase Eha subunit C